jgi:hypothetical protein
MQKCIRIIDAEVNKSSRKTNDNHQGCIINQL